MGSDPVFTTFVNLGCGRYYLTFCMTRRADDWLSPAAFRRHSSEAEAARAVERRGRASDLERRLARNPSDTDASVALAGCLEELGEHAAALDALHRGLAKRQTIDLYLALAIMLANHNRAEEAMASARDGLRLFPDSAILKLKAALTLPVVYDSADH